MLTLHVCMRCWNINLDEVEVRYTLFGHLWFKTKTVACPPRVINSTEEHSVLGDPPEHCPHKFRHAVALGMGHECLPTLHESLSKD
jgi:hypothetical protein